MNEKVKGIYGSKDNPEFVRGWLLQQGANPKDIYRYNLTNPENIYVIKPDGTIDVLSEKLSYLIDCITAPKKETYVDLGLPSGTLWCDQNLLSDSIPNHGGFFPYALKRPFSPKKWQYEELIEECEWEWTDINGFTGYKVKGKNGNHIFLPAAGIIVSEGNCCEQQSLGVYWSSTKSCEGYGWALYFNSHSIFMKETLCAAERTVRTIKV